MKLLYYKKVKAYKKGIPTLESMILLERKYSKNYKEHTNSRKPYTDEQVEQIYKNMIKSQRDETEKLEVFDTDSDMNFDNIESDPDFIKWESTSQQVLNEMKKYAS
jgi:hypothetical protein